jgi:hypothetical protein
MKRIILIRIIAIILTTSMVSCENFLTENPKAFLSPETAFSTKNDIFAGTVAVYDALGNGAGANYYGRRFMYLNFLCSDEITSISLVDKNLDNFTFNATEINVSNSWTSMYSLINRANVVLAAIPQVSMSATDAGQFEGELKFLRGLTYFNLVRTFGNVPIQDGPTTFLADAYKERNPIAEVYKFIISDLTFAKDNLAATNQNGRATSGAAKGLLAKVYLTRASSTAAQTTDYQSCVTLCSEVISSGTYSLMSNFEKAIGKEDAYNKESMFEVEFQRQNFPNELGNFGVFMMPKDPWTTTFPSLNAAFSSQAATYGTADLVSEIPFFNRFNPLDYRRDQTFVWTAVKGGVPIDYTKLVVPYPHCPFKYINRSKPTDRSGYTFEGNVKVLRLADVYLMKAEALNEISGPTTDAYAAINAIRTRARNRDGLSTNGYPADLAGLTKETFRDAVMDERMIELAFEGHRWYDLVRTKRLVSLYQSLHPEFGITDKNLLFPIPQDQILLKGSKLIQNTGW